ncbi:MAG: tetratricopeptide repeat protein [Sulfurovum sp.]|nr:tetratricopeptide repeat protein [Sulfurovum sp.]
MKSKTFRLFISSTFNDFAEERKILQTKVFPRIKEYASTNGYSFQPIDLRWGVNNEAQLDQKTLALCLSEVRACKTNPHPNFLIMIGDRYGWVPLPYAIEEQELTALLKLMTVEDKVEILEWYKLDLNQLPASYVLKERTEEFEDYDTWLKVEGELREIFQAAANNSNISEEKKRKYFLSATEAEVEEGILPYGSLTNFQKDVLLIANKDILKVDSKHIFGFFRDIAKSTQQENKFIVDDYDEAQRFKQEVKKQLPKKNTLHVKTKQINKEALEDNYIKEFEERTIKFLISQIDEQKSNEMAKKLTSLEIELEAQRYFAEQKRKDFISQEGILKDIDSYISSQSKEALIIYGKSGIGKTSLIAKSVQEAENKVDSSKKILYRFIGATPYSSSSKEILSSLFEELGIDIRSEKEKKGVKDETIQVIDYVQETLEEFSYRIYDEIRNIKEDLVIFIDAVDQLENDEQFLWLPNNLPSNVKIVISALSDEKYEEATQYFKTLKKRIKVDNLIEIADFNEPLQLLNSLLKKENRTLQEDQENYFLEQYKTANSPLYVVIALQELKHWKSYDYVEGSASKEHGVEHDLKQTQRGIIKEFIENLSGFYHHNKEFVSKVLGYIYASRDGLSESELLQLISIDKEFIEKVAPQEFHKNHNLELPLVHWSRFHVQLKPFLSSKIQYGEELMYFFHREFEDVIKDLTNQRKEHDAILKSTQKLINLYQCKEFDSNRWGKLYATLIIEYELRYKDKKRQKEYSVFISILENEEWIMEYVQALTTQGINHSILNHDNMARIYQESTLHTLEKLYDFNHTLWAYFFTTALNNLSWSYKRLANFNDAIPLEERSLLIRENMYEDNPDKWGASFITSLNNLALSYGKVVRIHKCLELLKFAFTIAEKSYNLDPKKYASEYTGTLINLASAIKSQNHFDHAIALEQEVVEIRKDLYLSYPSKWAQDYSLSLNNLAYSYEKRDINKAIELLYESYKITEKYYKINPKTWAVSYRRSLTNLGYAYEAQENMKYAYEFLKKSLEITSKLFNLNSEYWALGYVENLNSLAFFLRGSENRIEAIGYYKKSLEISTSRYKYDKDKWVDVYNAALGNLKFLS